MYDFPDNLSEFYSSNSNNSTKKEKSELFNLDTGTINNIKDHYLCSQCHKFPYIKFYKDRKHIRLTCSCFNNKKMLIKDLFETNILSIENKSMNFISTNNLNDDIENELICKEHNEKFKGFSKIFLDNYCQSCIDNQIENDIIIKFDDIKIEDIKKGQILKKNDNIKSFEESNINSTNIIIEKNNCIWEILSKEEEEAFNKLINIIINDYKNYPNFSHYFNIKNLLYCFNNDDIPITEKEYQKLDNKYIKNKEPIIIEYINNISYETKLFNKTFVKNNKNNFKIEIDGQILDLIEEYKFIKKG